MILQFPKQQPKQIFIKACDKPECPRCLHRSDWTMETYRNADEADQQWMCIKGFQPYDTQTA